MTHFAAVNWMVRDESRKHHGGGFSNEEEYMESITHKPGCPEDMGYYPGSPDDPEMKGNTNESI